MRKQVYDAAKKIKQVKQSTESREGSPKAEEIGREKKKTRLGNQAKY